MFSVYLREWRLKIELEQQCQSEATRHLLLFNVIERLRFDSHKKQAHVTSASACDVNTPENVKLIKVQ